MNRLTRLLVEAHRRSVSLVMLGVGLPMTGAVTLVVGCGDDALDPNEVLSVTVTPADTLIFAADAVTFEAVVEYRSGPGEPDSVAWSVSDATVLALSVGPDGRATVTGIEHGEAFLIAEVDQQRADSAQVTVVEPGDVRWRAEFPHTGPGNGGPTLDGSGRIFVIDALHWLVAFDRDGNQVLHEYSPCSTLRMPAVTPEGRAHIVGGKGGDPPNECTERRAPDGSLEWIVPVGLDADVAPAVGLDGSVAVQWGYGVGDAVMIALVSSEGTELWRATLFQGRVSQKNSPSIAANGDIYAQVRWLGDPEAALWRIAADGTIRWLKPIGLQYGATPTLIADKVIVSVRQGLAAYDTAGTLLWQVAVPGSLSSPIVDGAGHIYVASSNGLRSFDLQGNPRWVADTVVSSGDFFWMDPPTLLSDGLLLVDCRSVASDSELCAVGRSDGELIWRTELGGAIWGSPAVAPDGTIYVYYASSWDAQRTFLLALWGDSPPLTEGWPTEGGGMGRLRRQVQ